MQYTQSSAAFVSSSLVPDTQAQEWVGRDISQQTSQPSAAPLPPAATASTPPAAGPPPASGDARPSAPATGPPLSTTGLPPARVTAPAAGAPSAAQQLQLATGQADALAGQPAATLAPMFGASFETSLTACMVCTAQRQHPLQHWRAMQSSG